MKVVAVEPPAGELVQGLRNLDDGFVPPIFDPAVLDRKLIVRPRESIEWTRRLLERVRRVRRHLVGRGGGRRGRRPREQMDAGTIVTLLPDGGWKYLSSGAWTDPIDEVVERAHAHQLLVTRDADDRRAPVAALLRAGGLVAFPTETVYGLGADAANADALRRLYAVKGRPADHPVIVHIARAEQLDDFATRRSRRRARARRRVLARTAHARRARATPTASPTRSTGGRDTVGLRVPDHPVALALLDAFGGGVAAPSANRFGQVSPTTAAARARRSRRRRRLVLDGGPCRVGVESTIVDVHRRRAGRPARRRRRAQPQLERARRRAARAAHDAARSRRRARSRRTTRRRATSSSSTRDGRDARELLAAGDASGCCARRRRRRLPSARRARSAARRRRVRAGALRAAARGRRRSAST